jgi:hypothetical protein
VEYYAAIDVSLELSSVCVVDETGKIVREMKVASEPEALVALFKDTGLEFARIGLEAGPLSQWLHAGLTAAGLPAILIETRHVKAGIANAILISLTSEERRVRPHISFPEHSNGRANRPPGEGLLVGLSADGSDDAVPKGYRCVPSA